LTQLALAMHTYNDRHGRLPPAAVRSADGQPLLSWRVVLLPLLGYEDLYEQFHLDEPWDSPHNIQLLPKIPVLYAPRKRIKAPGPGYTVQHVFVGKGTAFEDPEGVPLTDFPDGTSRTFLIVEAGPPVPWTKPEELAYVRDGALPDLTGPFPEGFRAAFADGIRHWIRTDVKEQTLRALITRNGGEKISMNEFEY
jgi:hypothetical protein